MTENGRMAAVFCLSDLESREWLDAGHTKPARLAVIGYPVGHSASPAMHQPALDARGIAARYVRVEVEPGRVAEAMARMADLDFVGCNVTVPHKFEAMDACDEVDPAARDLGAVNTVRFEQGKCRGFNTDGPGFVRAIGEEFGVAVAGLRVLVVGAGGGVGNAIATQCARESCAGLVLVNRSVEKLEALAARLGSRLKDGVVPRVLALDDPGLPQAAAACDLIVNCTSLGLRAGDPSPLTAACFAGRHMVYDTIYQPPRTPMLEVAGRAGARCASGASMLLHQGALAFELWFPGEAPLEVMRKGLA